MTQVLTARRSSSSGVVDTYVSNRAVPVVDRPARLSYDALATINGGRLPLGARGQDSAGTVPVTYTQTEATTFSIGRDTGRITDIQARRSLVVLARFPIGTVPLTSASTTRLDPAAAATAGRAAEADHHAAGRRSLLLWLAGLAGTLTVLLLLPSLGLLGGAQRRKVLAHPARSPSHPITK